MALKLVTSNSGTPPTVSHAVFDMEDDITWTEAGLKNLSFLIDELQERTYDKNLVSAFNAVWKHLTTHVGGLPAQYGALFEMTRDHAGDGETRP